MACFWAVMTAAPCSTIRLNSAGDLSFHLLLSSPHRIMESTHVHVRTSDTGVLIHDIAHFIHDGAADRGNVDAVFHDDVDSMEMDSSSL